MVSDYYDSPEDIELCLNCNKPFCNNCLSRIRRNRPRKNIGREVLQIDKLTDEPIAIYETAKDASIILEISSSGIYACLHGKRITAGGYKWKLAKEATKPCTTYPKSNNE